MAKVRPDVRAEVLRLYTQGLRSTAIAQRLGITRSAASGYVSRLGLSATKIDRTTLIFPQRGCLWIEGEVRGADTRFCGKPLDPGTPNPWCPEHRRRVYTVQKPADQK